MSHEDDVIDLMSDSEDEEQAIEMTSTLSRPASDVEQSSSSENVAPSTRFGLFCQYSRYFDKETNKSVKMMINCNGGVFIGTFREPCPSPPTDTLTVVCRLCSPPTPQRSKSALRQHLQVFHFPVVCSCGKNYCTSADQTKLTGCCDKFDRVRIVSLCSALICANAAYFADEGIEYDAERHLNGHVALRSERSRPNQ
jgi:hypothetical protein